MKYFNLYYEIDTFLHSIVVSIFICYDYSDFGIKKQTTWRCIFLPEEIIILMPNHEDMINTKQLLIDNNIDIPVYEAMMESAKELVSEKIKQGTRVIISRGMTSSLLRSSFNIHVVEIRYNFFDFCLACKNALQYSNRIAIAGFNPNFNVPEIAQFFDFKQFQIRVIKNRNKVPKVIKELKQSGIEVIIGGHTVCEEAESQNIKSVNMPINKKSILNAVTDAQHINRLETENKKQLESIANVLDQTEEGIITVDRNGLITSINRNAQRMLGINDINSSVRITDYFSQILLNHILEGFPYFNQVLSINNSKIIFNAMAIQVSEEITGAVITMQNESKVYRMEQELRKRIHSKGYIAKNHFSDIIGKSPSIKMTKEKAMLFAKVDSTVLIYGPTGTGKELFAQSIHNHSNRFKKPFVAINCAALPESVLESELFGYVKGAFTGARPEGKMGIFEQAHTGTIFLDEISEISPSTQARLLRVIQEREIVRIGDDRVIPIDVRIIASTNRNLLDEVNKKNFREDLYYRLSVLNLSIPPLNERKEDIPLLLEHFIYIYANKFSKNIKKITSDAFDQLIKLDWPGNIRQLCNIVECAIAINQNGIIDKNLFSSVLDMVDSNTDNINIQPISHNRKSNKSSLSEILETIEKFNGNKTLAAKELGIGYTTLWRKLKAAGKL